MIPNNNQVKALWDKYDLPEKKRIHCELVARVAVWMARQLKLKTVNLKINEDLLRAAALLHDIDKNILKLPGEGHPDAGVRVLQKEGMEEIADLVRTHPLHAILSPAISPKTWEEKLLFLADKMVKYDVITVDKRFALWREESLPADAAAVLEAAHPKVKELEKEICDIVGVHPLEVARFVKEEYNQPT